MKWSMKPLLVVVATEEGKVLKIDVPWEVLRETTLQDIANHVGEKLILAEEELISWPERNVSRQ